MIKRALAYIASENALPTYPVARATKKADGSYDIELAIRCLISRDANSGLWIAQGLDLDFVASSYTEESAMQEFSESLMATIEMHLDEYGSIDALVKPAPKSLWKDYYAQFLKLEPRKDQSLHCDVHDGVRARARGNLRFFPPPDAHPAH
jgi:hypothetical protein